MSILTFHSVENKFHPGINNYSPHRFENMLKNLKAEGFCFRSLSDYLNNSHPDNIAVTFDDGYESFALNVIPVLQELNIPASLFIPFNYMGRKADWDFASKIFNNNHLSREQLIEIASHNIEIGSHGLSHTSLTDLSPRMLEIELRHSKTGLEDIIGRPVKYISYPFGRYNAEIENRCADSGYQNGFSLSYLTRTKYNFTHPRFAVYATDTTYSVIKKIKAGLLQNIEKLKGAVINSYAGGTIILNRLRRQDNP
ncbi:MAG: polysaccharide deacetylase family protein [Candidatus Zixiibacteriota bacterium]